MLCSRIWQIALRLQGVLSANIRFHNTGFCVKSVWLLISLPASVSLEQILIRANWSVLKRSCMLSTFNFFISLRWEPVCVSLFLCTVCCVAVRNCLECRQRHWDKGNKSSILNNSKTQEIMQHFVTSNKVGCHLKHLFSVLFLKYSTFYYENSCMCVI